jgi:hypothetical protein
MEVTNVYDTWGLADTSNIDVEPGRTYDFVRGLPEFLVDFGTEEMNFYPTGYSVTDDGQYIQSMSIVPEYVQLPGLDDIWDLVLIDEIFIRNRDGSEPVNDEACGFHVADGTTMHIWINNGPEDVIHITINPGDVFYTITEHNVVYNFSGNVIIGERVRAEGHDAHGRHIYRTVYYSVERITFSEEGTMSIETEEGNIFVYELGHSSNDLNLIESDE